MKRLLILRTAEYYKKILKSIQLKALKKRTLSQTMKINKLFCLTFRRLVMNVLDEILLAEGFDDWQAHESSLYSMKLGHKIGIVNNEKIIEVISDREYYQYYSYSYDELERSFYDKTSEYCEVVINTLEPWIEYCKDID